MIADCHMHTAFSSDSETDVEEQVKQAIALGMERICITDHMDMDYPTGEFDLDTDAYYARIKEIQEKYKPQIHVGFGVELGLQKHLRERQDAYIQKYPFDFVIGSMHLVQGTDPYDGDIFRQYGDAEAYRIYFEETLENLKAAPRIQTLGHLDYAVRYGIEKDKEYSYKKYADQIDAILQYLIQHEIALEVNTGGYKKLGNPNPHPDVIRRYKELGGQYITVGADAHTPEVVGYGFDLVKSLLLECKFTYYTVFEGQKPLFLPL